MHWLDGGESTPTFRRDRPSLLRVAGRATLVDNAETLAHVALIDRHGAAWFREVGRPRRHPAPRCSASGRGARRCASRRPPTRPRARCCAEAGMDEPVGGHPARRLRGHLGRTRGARRAPRRRRGSRRSAPSAARASSSRCPHRRCGLAETASIARYMASESAGQCGPCAFGLPAIAEDLDRLARGLDHRALEHLARRTGAVEGRGACRHPDGVVRMVRSALVVFADDARRHADGPPLRVGAPPARSRRCPHRPTRGLAVRTAVAAAPAVDPIACDGFGHCAELAPELVGLDEWGYPVLLARGTRRRARRGARAPRARRAGRRRAVPASRAAARARAP